MEKKPTVSKHYYNSSIVFLSDVCINNKSMPFNHPADRIRETMVASDCDSFSIFITAWYKKMIFQSGHHWCMDCVTKLYNHQRQQQKLCYFLYKNWNLFTVVGCPHAFQTIFLLPAFALCSKNTNAAANLLYHFNTHFVPRRISFITILLYIFKNIHKHTHTPITNDLI